ncbi:hypothetical protein F1D05_02640 [Kribbella qitaiheensis]|uniref:Uncharacterized protein n=1 Tax=Kribbella qitaiheensis TaxID=1544730 RepID=A0A7G6WSP3_9ACTN|nr:hypothetical protein [Kribbella qitaiheensis]QNE17008.1 hypothetical protein F1D05_02640 [Kribbella qitaiheensis]
MGLAVGLYLFLRWILHPLAIRLPASIDLIVDATSALFLTPEYLGTTISRKLVKRPLPLAFLYGEAVCGLACLVHGLGLTLADALRNASAEITHRQALIGGAVGGVCLVILS